MKAKYETHHGLTRTGIKVTLGTEQSDSKPGESYEVYISGPVRCTCADNTYRPWRNCKHIARHVCARGDERREREYVPAPAETDDISARLAVIEEWIRYYNHNRLEQKRNTFVQRFGVYR